MFAKYCSYMFEFFLNFCKILLALFLGMVYITACSQTFRSGYHLSGYHLSGSIYTQCQV